MWVFIVQAIMFNTSLFMNKLEPKKYDFQTWKVDLNMVFIEAVVIPIYNNISNQANLHRFCHLSILENVKLKIEK